MDTTNTLIIPTFLCVMVGFIVYLKRHKKKLDTKLPQENDEKEKETPKQPIKLKNENTENPQNNEENIKQINEKNNTKLNFNLLFEKFCDFIQKNQLISIESMSKKLNKTKEDTIKLLRELETEGKTIGFLGDDGEYFYLTTKQFELLNNILINSKEQILDEEELEKQFRQICKENVEL